MNTIRQVIDEAGAVHTLVKRIGVGGQGEVWLAQGGRRIVKLLNSNAHSDVEALRRQFAFVRRLDLTGLHVARPTSVLKPPHVGYVAEFLGDMVPIKALMEAPQSDLLRWHLATGSLRRRLRLLAHAGEVLMGLHARGVVYADVSHNNVFVSGPVNAHEAWLIDPDNLSHLSDPQRAIYTPGYGAPEVVAGTDGCTSLSDAWAFAVLVWQTLTLTHPFVGDLVNDGEPEMEERAFAGQLPWVAHSSDNTNRCSTGLPANSVMAGRLMELARKTFEEGVDDRKRRASISDWVESLHAAADRTLACLGCGGTHVDTEAVCPWCTEPAQAVSIVRIARWQPRDPKESPKQGQVSEGAVRLGQLSLTKEFSLTKDGLILTRRVTCGLPGVAGREPHVELTPVERGVRVRVFPGLAAWVALIQTADDKRYPVPEGGSKLPENGGMVFFEDPNQPQRVALVGRSK